MIITGNPIGRTGNQIFQYCMARIIANMLNRPFQSFPIKEFPGCTNHSVFNTEYDPKEVDKIQFKQHGKYLDLEAVISALAMTVEPKPYKVGPGPQNIDYLKKYRKRISQWLGFNKPDKHNVIAVNVRLTDYVDLKWAMSPEYYVMKLREIRKHKNLPIRILSDEPGHPMMRVFDEFTDAEILDLGPRETMDYLAGARIVILSQSTFSFWPTWCSEACENVHFPLPNNSLWSPHLRYDKHGTMFEFVNLFDPEVHKPVRGAHTIAETPTSYFE